MSNDATRFGLGHASGDDWHAATQACVAQLDPPAGANLGFVYVTDELADDLGKLTALLVQETGVVDRVDTPGLGICATGREHFEEPAGAALVCCFPEDTLHVFNG